MTPSIENSSCLDQRMRADELSVHQLMTKVAERIINGISSISTRLRIESTAERHSFIDSENNNEIPPYRLACLKQHLSAPKSLHDYRLSPSV
jgi:hypothetical protein